MKKIVFLIVVTLALFSALFVVHAQDKKVPDTRKWRTERDIYGTSTIDKSATFLWIMLACCAGFSGVFLFYGGEQLIVRSPKEIKKKNTPARILTERFQSSINKIIWNNEV